LIIANQSSLQRKITMQERHLCWPPYFFPWPCSGLLESPAPGVDPSLFLRLFQLKRPLQFKHYRQDCLDEIACKLRNSHVAYIQNFSNEFVCCFLSCFLTAYRQLTRKLLGNACLCRCFLIRKNELFVRYSSSFARDNRVR